MSEAGTDSGQFLDQFRFDLGDLLHVTAVASVQYLALDTVTGFEAVTGHFRTLAQHLGSYSEILFQDRSRPLLASQFQGDPPAGQGHFPRGLLGENQRFRRTVFHAEHGQGGTQS